LFVEIQTIFLDSSFFEEFENQRKVAICNFPFSFLFSNSKVLGKTREFSKIIWEKQMETQWS